jgi:hypothetical protein
MDFFLFDTNIFRAATKSPGGKLLQTLLHHLGARLGLQFNDGGQRAFRITPFGLLEALGIVPPKPPETRFDFDTKAPNQIYSALVDSAKAFYSTQPQLQKDFLLEKHDEQRGFTTPQAMWLFDTCVTSVLNRDVDLTGAIASFLAHDYFFNYQFTPRTFKRLIPLLACMFFIDAPQEGPASRFRISKRMHDQIQGNLQYLPEYPKIAPALKMKAWKDLLDTDIIQDITFGFPYEGTRHRVTALTFDNAETLEQRAILHRQVGISLAKKCVAPDLVANVIKPYLAHPGGCIVQFDELGAIVRFIDLSPRFLAISTRA